MKKQIYICDRCGNSYEQADERVRAAGPRPRIITTSNDHYIEIYSSVHQSQTRTTEAFDLCPACARALFEWIYDLCDSFPDSFRTACMRSQLEEMKKQESAAKTEKEGTVNE